MPKIEVETHKVGSPDIVVPTLDTVRHESLLYTWLAEHKPMVLCGPPGSGKTMTLFSALRALPDFEVWHIYMYLACIPVRAFTVDALNSLTIPLPTNTLSPQWIIITYICMWQQFASALNMHTCLLALAY